MDQPLKQSIFFTCPACQGTGQLGVSRCSVCGDHGLYLLAFGRLYYWGKKINEQEIWRRRLADLTTRIYSFFLLLLGLAGIISLARLVWKISSYGFVIDSLLYEKHPKLLFFWFSALVDLYIYYRMSARVGTGKEISGKDKFLGLGPDSPSSWEEVIGVSDKLKVDISPYFEFEARRAIEQSWQLAKKLKHRRVEPLHFLASSLGYKKSLFVFGRLGVSLEVLKNKISQAFLSFFVDQSLVGPDISLNFKQVLLAAYQVAIEKRHKKVEFLDVLVACGLMVGSAQEVLYDLEIDGDKLSNVILWIEVQEKLIAERKKFSFLSRFKPKGAMNRAMTAIATPVLDHFSQDLTLLARLGYLGLCVARDQEIEEIFAALATKNGGVVLVGNPGTGRTTIAEGVAQRMVAEEVPKFLQDKRFVSLSLSALVAGASQMGSVEERVAAVMDEVRRSGNIILFLSDIHNMIGIQTTQGELDVSEILAQILKQGSVYVLATTTPADYRRYIEGTAIDEVLVKINIEEPKGNQAIQILEIKSGNFEYRHQVFFSYGSIVQAVELSSRYIHERYLPEKAVGLLEQAAVNVRKSRGKNSIIQKEDVALVVAEKTNIPVTKISEKESEKLLHLEEKIHEKMIDQDPAVKSVASALRRARVNLRDIKRPIANLLFLGPTGVGKTQLTKIVAASYFGSEKNMIRLDMSEYQENSSIERIVGDVSSKTAGFLTEAVRQNPFSLVLLDEIEKAHPDILNVFLQVMDDGRLTDSFGRTVDFTNVILIATSNAGSQYIQDAILAGNPYETVKRGLMERELKSYFRPEFLNRFDDIIVFKPLSPTEIKQIAILLLVEVRKQMELKGVNLEFTEEAVIELAEQGFDPVYGARPLRRVIQEQVNNALAEVILKGEVGRRDTVVLDKGGKIIIEKAKRL